MQQKTKTVKYLYTTNKEKLAHSIIIFVQSNQQTQYYITYTEDLLIIQRSTHWMVSGYKVIDEQRKKIITKEKKLLNKFINNYERLIIFGIEKENWHRFIYHATKHS